MIRPKDILYIDITQALIFSMINKVEVRNETSTLKHVILGTAHANGKIPKPKDAYDPTSLQHILANTYPHEEALSKEISSFATLLEKYGVKVYRPEILENINQIFARDIGFVIDQYFFKANTLPERKKEWLAIQSLIHNIHEENIIDIPENVHIEGGDVILWNQYIFIGTYQGNDYSRLSTARTNPAAVSYLKDFFPQKEVLSFDLIKSTLRPEENVLHLDCCFQPVGNDKVILGKDGFISSKESEQIIEIFGKENIFFLTKQEMTEMHSNVFSINPQLVVSDKRFRRLNHWLHTNGIQVEEIKYQEVGKQGGLLRCSTLPLLRD